MRLLFVLLFALALVPSGVTLDAALEANDLYFEVRTDAPRQFYVQIDTAGGVTLGASPIYQFSLGAGEGFARTIPVQGGLTMGAVSVRVWASDGGEGPVAEQTIPVPAQIGVSHVRMPVVLH